MQCVNDVSVKQNCVTVSVIETLTFVLWNFFHTCPPRCGNLKIKTMNTTEVKGNWNEQKGKLKQKFAVLTDNDLMFDEGKKDEMLGKLQIKLGKTKEELQRIIGSI
jgi:uncharacterized protein YjbJ (UPF0337 family)